MPYWVYPWIILLESCWTRCENRQEPITDPVSVMREVSVGVQAAGACGRNGLECQLRGNSLWTLYASISAIAHFALLGQSGLATWKLSAPPRGFHSPFGAVASTRSSS